MNIPMLGGIEIGGINKAENSINCEIILKTPNNNIENETVISLTPTKIFNDKKFNDFFKKDLNNKIKNFIPTLKITKFLFDNGKNQTIMSFIINKKLYNNVIIDWQYTKDELKLPAPYVSGKFFIDTRLFNSKIFNTYYEYFVNSKDTQSNIIGQTNLLLLLETIESQRNVSILNLLISLNTLIDAFNIQNKNLFSLTRRSYEKGEFSISYNYCVNNNFKVDCNIFITYLNNVYEIHNENGFEKEAIYALYMNFYNQEDLSIVEFNTTSETNEKYFENNISIFNKDNILFSFETNEIKNILLSLNNILLNAQMEIIEIQTVNEEIELKLNEIFKSIEKENDSHSNS